jgi:hypothetical protein
MNERRGQMYTLGRFVDRRECHSPASDFYRYDIQSKSWTVLSRDTAADGGPDLIYDHQMCMNSRDNVIYVFGGRVVSGAGGYGGLYQYACDTNSWTLLRADQSEGRDQVKLVSRIDHSMLFSETDNALLFFAGQRSSSEPFSDFYKYMLDTSELVEISRDSRRQGGPPALSQRATIDAERKEMYVLSGLVRVDGERFAANGSNARLNNTLWVYNLARGTWVGGPKETVAGGGVARDAGDDEVDGDGCNDKSFAKCADAGVDVDGDGGGCDSVNEGVYLQPCPRFAHQLVFDSATKDHYLFGGNPGTIGDGTYGDFDSSAGVQSRLGDFWRLKMTRQPLEEVLRKCTLHCRRQRYLEMCAENPHTALLYLQHDLHAVVDHSHPAESADFRSLTASLFAVNRATSSFQEARLRVFEKLVEFFPSHMKEPKANLIDCIPLI